MRLGRPGVQRIVDLGRGEQCDRPIAGRARRLRRGSSSLGGLGWRPTCRLRGKLRRDRHARRRRRPHRVCLPGCRRGRRTGTNRLGGRERRRRASRRPVRLAFGELRTGRRRGNEVGHADEGRLGTERPWRGLSGPDEPEDQGGMEEQGANESKADPFIRKTSEPAAPIEGRISPRPTQPSTP